MGAPGALTVVEHKEVSAARAERVGLHAWRVRVAGPVEAASLASWLREQQLDCDNVVPAASSVLVDGPVRAEHLHELLAAWRPGQDAPRVGALVEVPVDYCGPDLVVVARTWGVDVGEVVARHTSIEFVATFSGFAPGFTYLSGLPAQWAVPRRRSPRDRVPAGSVAVADQWCGVYPTASPGGWMLLGVTELVVWDLAREGGPALLAPGTRVKFVAR